MRRAHGRNVKIDVDSTGGLIAVDWDCPYCGEYNAGFYFSSNIVVLRGDFEIDHECDNCHKMVTIECEDSESLFPP